MTLAAHLSYHPEPEALARLRAALLPDVTLSFGPEPPDPPVYEVLVAGRPSRALITASPRLRALVIPFAGLPAVTRELMRDHPSIAVHNLHHNAIPTAEMAVGLLLAAARLIVPADRALRQGDWRPRYAPLPAVILAGETALIVGYGAVGGRVGAACRALGMGVIGIRRREHDPANGIYLPAALPELLPRARALVICAPGTEATEGLVGAAELARLPRGAVLVNVGRGDIVDPHALYEALRSGHLHAAGLDVWYTYPPDEAAHAATFPAEVPLHELDNVVLSPHRGGAGGHPAVERLRMAALAETLNAAARGEPLPGRVDLEEGY